MCDMYRRWPHNCQGSLIPRRTCSNRTCFEKGRVHSWYSHQLNAKKIKLKWFRESYYLISCWFWEHTLVRVGWDGMGLWLCICHGSVYTRPALFFLGYKGITHASYRSPCMDTYGEIRWNMVKYNALSNQSWRDIAETLLKPRGFYISPFSKIHHLIGISYKQ